MDYLYQNGGMLGSNYPYQKTQNTCLFSKTKVVAKSGSLKVKIDPNEQAHLVALQSGPISVVVDSSFLYYYKSGVILDKDPNNPCFR